MWATLGMQTLRCPRSGSIVCSKGWGKKKNESRYNIIFTDLLFLADFGVEFQKSTIIIPRRDIPDVFTKKAHRERSEQLMVIGCPDFTSHFAVYTEDETEARKLLAKPFLQCIIDLNRKHSGKVYLSFVGSCVFIAISKAENLLGTPSIQKYHSNRKCKALL